MSTLASIPLPAVVDAEQEDDDGLTDTDAPFEIDYDDPSAPVTSGSTAGQTNSSLPEPGEDETNLSMAGPDDDQWSLPDLKEAEGWNAGSSEQGWDVPHPKSGDSEVMVAAGGERRGSATVQTGSSAVGPDEDENWVSKAIAADKGGKGGSATGQADSSVPGPVEDEGGDSETQGVAKKGKKRGSTTTQADSTVPVPEEDWDSDTNRPITRSMKKPKHTQ